MLKVVNWCRFSCMKALWYYPVWDIWESLLVLIFILWRKKAKTKANTINQKSKLVHLHSKFIQWSTYVFWVDFFYCHFSINGLRTLATEWIFFFEKSQNLPLSPNLQDQSKIIASVLKYSQCMFVYYNLVLLRALVAKQGGIKIWPPKIYLPPHKALVWSNHVNRNYNLGLLMRPIHGTTPN